MPEIRPARREPRERVRRAVAAGLRRWSDGEQERSETAGPEHATTLGEATVRPIDGGHYPPGVVGPLSRRKAFQVTTEREFAPPAMRRAEVFHAGIAATLARVGVWLVALARFVAATVADRLRGRDTTERRAVRLRETLQRTGGTFIKFGQQLSVRADVLPYEYCRELMKMLDRVPPFPTEQAIAAIERTTGRRLGE